HLGSDAPPNINSTDCHALEGQVPRFGAVERGKQFVGCRTERILTSQAELGDSRTGVAALELFRQRWGLWVMALVAQEGINVHKSRAGQHALIADVATDLVAEVAQQLDLLIGSRRKVGVAALRC